MADYHTFIDTVKIEKANAIARYQRFRNLAKLLQFLQLVLLLAFLSWSSTRIPHAVKTFKISGKYVAKFSTYVLNPHVVFLIGNAIVLALYVLSRHIDLENSSTTTCVLYEDYEKTENQSAEMIEEEKQIVGKQNSNVIIGKKTENQSVEAPVEMIEEEEKQIVCKQNSNVIIGKKTPIIQIKKLNRAMSEKLQQVKPQKEFRRSETQVQRMIVNKGKFETVDTLSNEDFRLTVEAFIEKQQNFLREQRMAELIV